MNTPQETLQEVIKLRESYKKLRDQAMELIDAIDRLETTEKHIKSAKAFATASFEELNIQKTITDEAIDVLK